MPCHKQNRPTTWFDLNPEAAVRIESGRQRAAEGQWDVTLDQGSSEERLTRPSGHVEVDPSNDREWDFIHNTPVDPQANAFLLFFLGNFFPRDLFSQQEGALDVESGKIDGSVVDGQGDQSRVRWNS
jgi:hypothetical protein